VERGTLRSLKERLECGRIHSGDAAEWEIVIDAPAEIEEREACEFLAVMTLIGDPK